MIQCSYIVLSDLNIWTWHHWRSWHSKNYVAFVKNVKLKKCQVFQRWLFEIFSISDPFFMENVRCEFCLILLFVNFHCWQLVFINVMLLCFLFIRHCSSKDFNLFTLRCLLDLRHAMVSPMYVAILVDFITWFAIMGCVTAISFFSSLHPLQ